MERVEIFRAAFAAIVTAISAMFGWLGWLIIAWIAAMVLDWITGTAAAWHNGELSSKVAREGAWHKGGAVCVVLCSGLLDAVIGGLLDAAPLSLPFEYSIFLCPLVCIWYLVTEAISIIENAGRMGAPVPVWLSRRVKSLKTVVDDAAGGVPDPTGHGDTAGTQKPTEEDGEEDDDDDD